MAGRRGRKRGRHVAAASAAVPSKGQPAAVPGVPWSSSTSDTEEEDAAPVERHAMAAAAGAPAAAADDRSRERGRRGGACAFTAEEMARAMHRYIHGATLTGATATGGGGRGPVPIITMRR